MNARKGCEYSTAEHSQHGQMQCAACGKKITEGQYRAHKKSQGGDWRYVVMHRACCSDDPEWSNIDAQLRESAEKQERFMAACIAFRDEWGISDLDRYIEEGPTK